MMNDPISLPGFAELVRNRAYALWENEGRPFGRDAEHWRLSEEAIRTDLAIVAAPKSAKKAKAPTRKKAPAPRASLDLRMAASA
jgi:hypothetical protein